MARNGIGLRYGKIIEELDAMAGDCCYKYLLDEKQNSSIKEKDFYLVTVSVDRVDFLEKLSIKKDLRFSSFMLMAKGSTLMVKIDIL